MDKNTQLAFYNRLSVNIGYVNQSRQFVVSYPAFPTG